jgi:hypothetical protein
MKTRHYLLSNLFVLLCLFCASNTSAATLYTYTNAGNNGLWHDAGTWTTDPSGTSLVGSAIPANGDVVYILNGFTVILGANVTTTGHSIIIYNGGTLDLSSFTVTTLNSLSGSGTLRIKAGYFPTITSNSFTSAYAAGATVEFYDFTGALPISINYPNLTFTNSTASDHVITFTNPSAYSFTVFGNLTTLTTGSGLLGVTLGSQASQNINLTVNGNITIGVNTTLGIGAFNSTHAVSVFGNMTNNGTVQFSNTAQYTAASNNGVANLSFTGATDNTLICNGITNLFTLTVNKGLGSTNILSVTSSNTANLNLYSNGQLIMITNGTLRLGANIDIPRIYGAGSANYDVGNSSSSPMLWIDGATLNMNTAALVVYGKFRITAGSFTSLGGQGTVIREEGQYLIEGGTFTTEKFRPSSTATTHRGSFTMTGGTFNASGVSGSDGSYARFSLPYPEQVFIMSGGVLNVSNPQSGSGAANGGIHIGCKPSNYIVTGGTVNAILSGGASFFNIASSTPFWNLTVSRSGGTPTTVRLAAIGSVSGTTTVAEPLKVLNNFTIDGVNTPVFNASGLTVSVGKNFTISSGATYTPNANTTIFDGTGDQNLINNGTITSGFYNLTVNKPSGALILDGGAATYSVTQMLTLNSGILNDGGKTLQVTGNIYNDAIHTGTGNITLNGATTQLIAGDGNGIFGNLILNNSNVPGVRVTSDLAISGVLTLAGTGNSLFDIDLYRLSLTSTSATALVTTGNPFSSAKMIRTSGFQSDRGIRKSVSDLSAFTYAFGVGSSYTPATIQLTSAPLTYGTITARPVNSRHQLTVAGNTNNLTWYWKVVSAGFTGIGATAVSHMYQYVESSVSPAGDDVNYIPARYNPTTWTVISDLTKVNETTNVISFTGVGFIDGEFTAGVPAAFGTVKVFYSKRNGNWNDVTAGSTPWSNVSHSGPDATTAPVVGDHVFIGNGSTFNHTITITSNGQASGGLEINAGSTLDVGVYTGHNFGTFENSQITGSGVLRISSSVPIAEFPAGDFGNFIRSSGGTVEYYTTGAQDFTIPVNSSAPTNLPLISYNNILLTPATGRFIEMPDQDIRIYNTMTVQGASATGVVKLNSMSSKILTLNGNLTVASGNLQFQNNTAQTIIAEGNVSIGAMGIFDLASTGVVVTNTMFIEGSLLNNGIFDLRNAASYLCNTTFTGSSNTSITGTGATTDFNVLTVSKGTSLASILDVNASSFSLSGPALPLVLTNGTFRLTSAQVVTFATGVDFTIPFSARLSANGGTLQMTGNDGIDLLLAGTLEILNGTVNIGTTANDNSVEYAATGTPTLTASGGSLNIQSQVRRSFASTQGGLLYNQSGSSIVSVGLSNAATTTRGVFEMLNPGSSFVMSGGTLRITRASGSSSIADLYLHPSANTVTGGTIEIGTAATAQSIDVNSIVPVYNVTVTGTTNIARLEFNGITLRGSLTILSDNIFNANSLNVNIAGNFTNNNTASTTGIVAGGYRAGSATQTTTFNSTLNNQIITGTSGNLTNFANLVINNTFASGTVALQPNTNMRINGVLTLSNGTLAGAANTITAISTVSNSSSYTSTTGGSVTLAGSSSQFITGSGNGKFGNLTLNNANGASFGANQEITGTLTLSSGSLTIGAYALNISNTSLTAISGAGSTRYIITSGNLSDAGLTKAFAASVTNGNFIYPIGVSGKYTPANYTLSTGALGGNITIRPVNSKHPSATGSGTAFINYYWSVSNGVIILNALTHTYTYVVADEAGIPADYKDARFKGGAWTIGITPGNPNTTTRVITFTNTDVAGDYTTGEPTAFVNPTTYTSVASGDWESDLSVWDIDPPGTNLGPPAGSFVIIGTGTTVTMTANSKRMATLEVRGRLHLGNTIGHDFGTVSTSGAGDRVLQIQSSTFPSGNFSSFTAVNGGTVQYDGTVILPVQNTYNNLAFSGVGTKTLPNADLTINGNVVIASGTVTNAVNNRGVILLSSTGDFTNNAVFIAGSGPVFVGRHLVNSGSGTIFNAGSGTFGLRVGGNLSNTANAIFTMATDSLGVRGTFTNSATFTGSSGEIHVSGNLNNAGTGTLTTGAGAVSITGTLTNSSLYTAGTGATVVRGSYVNTGATAIHNATTNTLAITGTFTNSAGSIFNAGSGTTSVNGSWNNSSTFNAGSGSVTFAGSAAQVLTGATNFNNLSRVNGGSLTLNNSITVNGALTLASGNIVTGSNTIALTNTTIQPVSGYSTSSFIDGKVSISYPDAAGTSRVFPVGRGIKYRPVVIQQTALSSSAIVRVEMINTPPTGTYPTAVGVLSEARYYAIDQVSGTMNSPTVELSFNTNSPDEGVLVPGNAHILRATAPSGPWSDAGGAGVFSPAAPTGYTTSGITSIGNPTFFTLGYQNVILPITLHAFTAVLRDAIVELNWSTYAEKNNDFFTIERSADGIHFDSISAIQGAGTSARILYYSDSDTNPLLGISYYRLKQTDYDRKYTYSKTIVVSNVQQRETSFSVYPNPSRMNEPVFVRYQNEQSREAHVVITNVAGRIFFSGVADFTNEIDINALSLSGKLERGVYVIKILSGNFRDAKKFVVY